MTDARALIAALDLQPHPEGGWYRETWRAPHAEGDRAGGTAILFLLEEGQRSHWHRVDATEIWFWHAGHALRLATAATDAGPISDMVLGPDIFAGESPQGVITAGHWQSAEADKGWVLVSCTVTPGFEFQGFTLAPPGWDPASR
ncbi:cupin domain-containing protein [Sphingobium phenoxybenzoativorans]|uniref:cupin domain-containing protein n=1 Tax=Sphingobium phenoxybenzoativorans TaxID=1592790 RepID=UPI000B1EEF1E|nr:cupin domain-containing protein [Sphingobium phenoxybenzoativorans]